MTIYETIYGTTTPLLYYQNAVELANIAEDDYALEYDYDENEPELRALIRAFGVDDEIFESKGHVEEFALLSAIKAIHDIETGWIKPNAIQICATRSALSATDDEELRSLFKRLLDAEEMAS